MFPQNGGVPQDPTPQNNNYYESIQGLAMVCAVATTLIAAPYLNNFTADFVYALFLENYGEGIARFLGFFWEALVYAFVFYLSKIYVVAAVTTIALWLAARIPALAL